MVLDCVKIVLQNIITKSKCFILFIYLFFLLVCGGARGVMVIVVGNGHGDTSSNPERG